MHVLTLVIARPDDLLQVRAAVRALVSEVGFDEQEQVRFATAVSEVGREVLHSERTCEVHLDVDGPRITTTFAFEAGQGGFAGSPGLEAAAKLVDDVADRTGAAGEEIQLSRTNRRPASLRRPEELIAAVRAAVPYTPVEELFAQNRELAAALDAVTTKQLETSRLNQELEETNSGVMAMYAQLSEELEETNRGVVALYSELDDKSVQLQAASESKARFFAAVSHELRTPVNSILGILRVMREHDADPLTEEQQLQLRLMGSSAEDLLQLVNQLLDLAKAEAGRLEADPASVDVAQLAGELRGTLRPLLADGVELTIELPPGLPPVETDRTMLTHILRNLLVNAVRFTEAGSIDVTVTIDDTIQYVTITVADTGIGIAPEHQAKVFEEFFQVRGPLQARSKGTGLGLAHARRLAEILGGTLVLESDPGKGSAFALTIPVRWNANAGPHVVAANADRTGVPTLSVLIIDDDETFRTALRGMLQGLSHEVREVAGGTEALRVLQTFVPDLIFLDLRMPDMDGDEVLARIDEQPHLRSIPVAIVTSVDLGLEQPTGLGRAHSLLAKADISRDKVASVIATLRGSDA